MLMLHPVVGYGGREITQRFAPSRRALGEKAKRYCVQCMPSGVSKPVESREEKLTQCTCTEKLDRRGVSQVVTCDFCEAVEAEDEDDLLGDNLPCALPAARPYARAALAEPSPL